MRVAAVLAALVWSAYAVGQPAVVYKSVDDQGVVSFSDLPPQDTTAVEQLEIVAPSPHSTDEYQRNLEAMRETTDRMAEDRRAREKHRAEMRELAARTDAYRAAAEPPPAPVDRYLPTYTAGSYWPGYRPGHPPWRPGIGPVPGHPVVRPPIQPPPQGQRPSQGNAQLMRPITTR